MKRRIICLFLAVILLVSLMPAAFAAGSGRTVGGRTETQAAEYLYALGLFKGTGTQADGSPVFDLNKTPTRNQALIMLVRLLGKEQEAIGGSWDVPFTDVADSMRPYVGYAYTHGLTNGTTATTYSGAAAIRANQYITFVLRAMGYSSEEDFTVSEACAFADTLGLTQGQYRSGGAFCRGDVALISAAALSTRCRDKDVTLYDKICGQRTANRFEETLQSVSAAHKAIFENEESFAGFESYLVNDPATVNLLTDAEIKALCTPHAQKATITRQQAAQDVDVLFRALRSAYGAYYYFGQSNYDRAKAELTAWINTQSNVKVYELDRKLANAFAFMMSKDAHSRIGAKYLIEKNWRYEYYYCVGQEYARDEAGCYKYINGEKWYVQRFSDALTRMERSLSNAGELVYAPLLFCLPGQKPAATTVYLRSESGAIKTEAITWKLQEPYAPDSCRVADYKLLQENGIAYISVRCFDAALDETLRHFEESGAAVRDSRLIIFDLRSNGGGSDEYCRRWARNFSGEDPAYPRAFSNRFSRLREVATGGAENSGGEAYRCDLMQGKQIPNDIPIIVLMDDQCGSAGESMLNALRGFENTMVIGSNSAGYQLCGNGMVFTLPNSGLNFEFGASFQFWLTPESVDYKGYEPDVWCNPKTAVQTALRMLLRYDQISAEEWQTLTAKLPK